MPSIVAIRLVRITIDSDTDCGGCQCPLMAGEVAWQHEETWSIGCCQPCCRDAAVRKLAVFGEPPAELSRK